MRALLLILCTSAVMVQALRLPGSAAVARPQSVRRSSLSSVTVASIPDIDLNFYSKASGMKGKALLPRTYPSLGEVKASFPIGSSNLSTWKSLSFALLDVVTTAVTLFLGLKYAFPAMATLLQAGTLLGSLSASALWAFYSVVTGTCAMGMWVTAHECGHGAFSNNRVLQDTIGYLFHSLLLVPYFAWQRSHAVHHANTNHIMDGETHVPEVKGTGEGSNPGLYGGKAALQKQYGDKFGENLFGAAELVLHLVFGWPAYLLRGATSGPSRGVTNHFVPYQFYPESNKVPVEQRKQLFPPGQKAKVWKSDLGCAAVIAGLGVLTSKFGLGVVAAAYGGPLLVVNTWLVLYTWLQHTDVDVPHLPAEGYSFVKGAFHTIDRPYQDMLWGVVDFLHHHIGSTHVVHHIDSTIPHYRARAATASLQQRFPDLYLQDPTPVPQALWRVARKCFQVEKQRNSAGEELYVFVE